MAVSGVTKMTQENVLPEVVVEAVSNAEDLKTFALINENNEVIEVVRASSVENCIETLGFDENSWKESSYPEIVEDEDLFADETPTEIKPNRPGIGLVWDSERENFIFPKPEEHPSWILNEFDNWVPPIPRPEDKWHNPDDNIIDSDGKGFPADGEVIFEHYWDEESVSWKRVYKKWSREYRTHYYWDESNNEWIFKEKLSNNIPMPISEVGYGRTSATDYPEKYFIGIGTEQI